MVFLWRAPEQRLHCPREACGLFRQSSRRVADLAARRYSGAFVITHPGPRNLSSIARPWNRWLAPLLGVAKETTNEAGACR